MSKLENAELYAPKHFENVYTLARLHILHMCLCVCLFTGKIMLNPSLLLTDA